MSFKYWLRLDRDEGAGSLNPWSQATNNWLGVNPSGGSACWCLFSQWRLPLSPCHTNPNLDRTPFRGICTADSFERRQSGCWNRQHDSPTGVWAEMEHHHCRLARCSGQRTGRRSGRFWLPHYQRDRAQLLRSLIWRVCALAPLEGRADGGC